MIHESHSGSRDGINRLKIELGFKMFICMCGVIERHLYDVTCVLSCAAG